MPVTTDSDMDLGEEHLIWDVLTSEPPGSIKP